MADAPVESWYVYVIQSESDHSLYTGISRNPEERLRQHNSGKKGAKRTRGRGPWRLIAMYSCGLRGDALRLEYQLKGMSRERKLAWAARNNVMCSRATT